MKNYYEILEVSQKASPEVIEKAYKVLVKKYHPDLQENDDKLEAEQKIKLINEAYDILSDEVKRAKYDKEIKNNFVDIEEYNLILQENMNLKKELNTIRKRTYNYYKNNVKTTSNSTETQNYYRNI